MVRETVEATCECLILTDSVVGFQCLCSVCGSSVFACAIGGVGVRALATRGCQWTCRLIDLTILMRQSSDSVKFLTLRLGQVTYVILDFVGSLSSTVAKMPETCSSTENYTVVSSTQILIHLRSRDIISWHHWLKD
jgi:hypothetical protein